jgi:23S rRNA (guanosine2251-2'-O)-methyltransferase
MNSDLISGRNAVLEAVKNKRLAVGKMMVAGSASGPRIDEAKTVASERSIPIASTTTDELDDLTGNDSHQGIALAIEELHPHTLDDLMTRIDPGGDSRLFVLDQIQDPVNVGKLARAAMFFGFDGMIKTKDRSAPLSSTVIQSSAGAAARLPIAQVKNLSRTFERLKDERYWLVGMVNDAETSIEEVPVDRNLAVVIGHEGSGLRRLTRDESDYLVTVPGSGDFDSLNAATAGAISAYALEPQRSNEPSESK